MIQKFMPVVGAAVGLAIIFGASGQASAVVCSGIYSGLGTPGQANGTLTLPGTSVGTVQSGCQIGDLDNNNVSGTGVFIRPLNLGGPDPSIFQFDWGGGNLGIQFALGNNGTLPNGVDVELGPLANTLVASGGLSNFITSINFSAPFVFKEFKTLFNGPLVAGTYVIDTYSGNLSEDPTYQINFSVGGVPEPGTLGLIGLALLGLGAMKRRRQRAH